MGWIDHLYHSIFYRYIFTYSNTSIYHLGGGAIMIIGAFMIGRKKKEVIDAGIGIACGVLAIVLGTLLNQFFMEMDLQWN